MSSTRTPPRVRQAHPAPSSTYQGKHRRTRRTALLALIATAGWAASLTLSVFVDIPRSWHEIVLFGHLASLVAGLGAVLAVDFHALQWLLRRRSLRSVLIVAGDLTPLVWVGFVGLLATGALLTPDLSNPLTITKLTLVLLVGLNGAYAGHIQVRMSAAGEHNTRLIVPAVISATISQVAWWAAALLGFISTQV
jgi:hypothetical protein